MTAVRSTRAAGAAKADAYVRHERLVVRGRALQAVAQRVEGVALRQQHQQPVQRAAQGRALRAAQQLQAHVCGRPRTSRHFEGHCHRRGRVNQQLTCEDRGLDELHQLVYLRKEIHGDLEVATGLIVKGIRKIHHLFLSTNNVL